MNWREQRILSDRTQVRYMSREDLIAHALDVPENDGTPAAHAHENGRGPA